MDKRYQVFISSTFTDLQEERREVIQALLELDCIPSGMELFPAADEDQWSLIERVIDDCDYYIVIIGGRYGSLSATGISYTQMEYEYAIKQGKPVMGFIHKDPGSIPASKTETSEASKAKLDTFRNLVQQKMCKYWSNSNELGSVVSRSLVQLIKNKPAIGWVRANLVPDESTMEEILNLRKQVEELNNKLNNINLDRFKDVEDLSQGDDIVQLRFSYYTVINFEFSDKIDHFANFETTWNSLFAAVAPYMLDELSEDELRVAVDTFVQDSVSSDLYKVHLDEKNVTDIDGIQISSTDFQTVKVQLLALGLITRTPKRINDKSAKGYWALTPYGEDLLIKSRAIKRRASTTTH